MKKIEVIKNFPQSNVCDVSIEYKDLPVLSFSPSPKGGPECLWFYFKVKVSNIKKIKIVLKHSYNMLGGGMPENLRPVIKFKGSKWKRLPKPEIINFDDGRKSVIWKIVIEKDLFEIALCYPYGKEEIEKLLKDTNGYWKKDVIGVSQEEREIIRLSNIYNGPEKKGVYLIARQHSGETPGSWVLDGFLRYLAEIEYKNLVVWAVPLSNIDGIENGFYGKDNFPYDLNRAWGFPPMRHETLAIQRDIVRWKERCIPFLAIDLHAPGASEKDGTYFFITQFKKDKKIHKIEKEIAEKISKKIGDYMSKDPVRSINYKSRWETPHFTDFIRENLKIPALSLETPYSICNDILMEESDYRKIGQRIAMYLIEEAENENRNF
ncbi:MAG: M14 family zinc carboxypeptidase [Candidatus Ratteibacteria bacterium]